MDRLNRSALFLLLLLAVSCGQEKAPVPAQPLPPPVPTPTEPASVFPVPYFPVRSAGLYGWTAAGVYSEDLLDGRQKAFVAGLEPAGGEGEVGLGFERDFDGDGTTESVSYGAYEQNGIEGNFVLVVRNSQPPAVLLKKVLPGPPRFTVFTLKSDGSLWFGGGIDAGEVTMNLTWDNGVPVFHHLTAD